MLHTKDQKDQNRVPLAMVQTMKKLKSGYINGTRVMLGNLGDFLNTSAITDLSFLGSQEDGCPDKLNPGVQSYLDEHLLRSFSQKTVNVKSVGLRPRHLRRRMSCKGAIKKTRSINVDSDTLGMEGNFNERRQSAAVPPPWLEAKQQPYMNVFVTSQEKGSMAETDEVPKIQVSTPSRHRYDTNFADTDVDELVAMLRETENLEEQGDILQYLVDTQGLDYNTELTGESEPSTSDKNESSHSEGMLEEGRVVTVRMLLKVLYEKASQQKLWGLIRHTAGMLGKRVEDLAKAITDLLVRQKQVNVLSMKMKTSPTKFVEQHRRKTITTTQYEKSQLTGEKSGVRLDYYQRIVHRLIMTHQQPVTGLFPASPNNPHAWIRDNVYCILAVWGLSMAYKKIADQDEDRAKAYELEQSCVKLMRGLLMAMMQQKDKVEKFKTTQSPMDSLHAKYSSKNGQSVVRDDEWGHLQIDAISLYLLILAQMTASGLQIVFSLDEVSFIQNLVFYIESAYCIPDYGIWERGDKTNHGLPELNASSIGMAKAALEAMNELDLFGARGGSHVLADEAHKCQAVLQSMLPRESNSKELDSGLLSIIGFPAFAVDDPQLILATEEAIVTRLQGKFGCKRFLRDGYRTPREDSARLYYERWELRMFENIECEWPLFYSYLILFHLFQGNKMSVSDYAHKLDEVLVRSDDGMYLMPESYAVPADLVSEEYKKPGSQPREVVGRCPFLWGQSLYILGKLLQEGFLAVGELDPLNRRLGAQKKPDVVVQVVILAEDNMIRDKLAEHDLHVQTIADVAPIEVQPARVLSHLYTYLGRNKKLGLSGRKSRDVGILSTSKLYSLKDRIFAFTPQFVDLSRFYIASHNELMIDILKGEINFLKSAWQNLLGRPLVTLVLRNVHIGDQNRVPLAMVQTMKKLKSGYINGTRVMLGNLGDFLNTSAITDLSFLGSQEDGCPDKLNPGVQSYLDEHLLRSFSQKTVNVKSVGLRPRHLRRRMSCKGAIKKTRSINVDSDTLGMEGNFNERRQSAAVPPPWLEAKQQPYMNVFVTSQEKGSMAETDEVPKIQVSTPSRHRYDTNFADTDVDELVAMLRETENLEEQGDILQYLVDTQGLDYNTELTGESEPSTSDKNESSHSEGMLEEGRVVTVRMLLKVLYEKASQQKLWGLIRHTAGMLGKRVEDLAKAITDLLVRQKQVNVLSMKMKTSPTKFVEQHRRKTITTTQYEKSQLTGEKSGVRLDYYQRIVHRLIMTHQQPVTGLFPASPNNPHAWIRDNVYCILAVWGLSMAYKKIADQDEDRAKAYELEQSCVKLMRGLLMAMMQQKDKVEKFKTTQSPMDSLHAKYSSKNGQSVVRDDEWGHLQIDAISLYLLILAQMTASGLQIVFSLDEVSFIQNLVFYIESAYCIPDYGIWERGDKTNHGLPELNASSIGMAKAALEAMNELDLFGARGGSASVIHVLADEAHKCQAVLQSMLPRESNSKELDSGLLSIIGFPAFAVDDPQLILATEEAIVTRLQGKFGCKRFLRDGYRTPREDSARLYYERWELRMFENIECEWPLFYSYLILFHLFQGNKMSVSDYAHKLDEVLVRSDDGMYLMPESYAVPADLVSEEYKKPGSQPREVVGRCPFLWGQSLYILGKLLQEGFLAVGELDPLNRRLGAQKKPDVVVQVVILAEDNMIRDKLAEHDLHVQTIADVAPIEVQPARVLSHLYTYLGRNKKLGLSGRKSRDVGILSTSKLYSLKDRIFAFTPQFVDLSRFYIASHNELMIDILKGEINFLKSAWQNLLGRPLVTLVLRNVHIGDQNRVPLAMVQTMKKLKSGYINGTRVMLGNLGDFLNTSAITDLSFLGSQEDGCPDKLNPGVQSYLDEHLLRSFSQKTVNVKSVGLRPRHLRRRMSCKGAIKKTRSINVDSDTLGMEGNFNERRQSAAVPPPWLEAKQQPYMNVFVTSQEKGSMAETDEVPKIQVSTPSRHRYDTNFADTDVDELVAMLRETENLEEQGDILQYLVDTQGLDYNTELTGESEPSTSDKNESSHSEGMLEEGRVVTVRMLLKGLYEKACQQKLWGLIRHTAGMLGKRVEDLAKAITDLLVRQKQVTVGMPPLNEHTITAPLPEFDLRQLIHEAYGDDESTAMLTQELMVYLAMFIRTEPQLFHEMIRLRVGLIIQVMAKELSRTLNCNGELASEHLLNLSPFEMKNLLYHILSGKEFAVSSGLAIEGRVLPQSLTQEMTPGELKFALEVETALNTIPQPEYRQLIVEALMVLTLVTEHNMVASLGDIISLEHLVHKANQIFLEDQRKVQGDATLCCAKSSDENRHTPSGMLLCGGAAYICQHLYDSAPSGSYGTMVYIAKAVASVLDCLPQHGDMDCTIS